MRRRLGLGLPRVPPRWRRALGAFAMRHGVRVGLAAAMVGAGPALAASAAPDAPTAPAASAPSAPPAPAGPALPATALPATSALAASAPAAADACVALAGLELPSAVVLGAEVSGAEASAGGRVGLPDGRAPVEMRRPFCRVRVSARPSADSDIRIDVWLPLPADWNGRLWGVGNGSWAGTVPARAMAVPLAAGYATVGTDTGHQADPSESAWARGHPEKIVDYGDRGIHEAAVAAKRVVAAYYGRPAAHAYFAGCSTGGRHGLMEAQRHPDDYDGILAGAPDLDPTLLYAGVLQMQTRWKADPARTLLPAKIPALRAAALAACDRADGAEDGVIADPPNCRFDPAVLACKGPETDRCLTPGQLATVRELYRGWAVPALHRRLAGYAVGSEEDWGWVHLGAGGPGTSEGVDEAVGFFANLVFADPAWVFGRFDPDRDAALADRRLGLLLNATDPDLRPFAARGGKLILFQGWNDPAVAGLSTIGYHRRVVETVGSGVADASVRLFMAPGMGHCGGGPGPDRFGQSAAGDGDPERSLGAALQRWVEQGVAPERVIAVKVADEADAAGAVVKTAVLCAYPKTRRRAGGAAACCQGPPVPALRRYSTRSARCAGSAM